MSVLEANSTDAATEKHVPVVTVEGDTVHVEVGSVQHPMEEDHYIEWIYLVTEHGVQSKCLKPGEALWPISRWWTTARSRCTNTATSTASGKPRSSRPVGKPAGGGSAACNGPSAGRGRLATGHPLAGSCSSCWPASWRVGRFAARRAGNHVARMRPLPTRGRAFSRRREARERGIPKVALGHDESGTRLRFSCAKSPTLRCGVRLWRRFPSSDLPTTALNHVFRALA